MRIFSSTRMQALLFRVVAHFTLAAIALGVPEVGENRFILAGLLIVVTPTIAIALNLSVGDLVRTWAEALLDLVMIVTLVHLVPHLWVTALCLGLMVALAPSVSLHPKSHWIYLGFGLLLLGGMSIAALVHGVSGWILPIAAVAATYPAMLFYTFSQMQRITDLRQQAQATRGMMGLAGSVAHDFNNLLVGIGGHGELARLALPDEHTSSRHLDQLLEGVQRASTLSRQLQDFSGHTSTQHGATDLALELPLLANLLRSVLRSEVELIIPERPLVISSNRSQVHRVLVSAILSADQDVSPSEPKIRVVLSGSSRSDPSNDSPDSQIDIVVGYRDGNHAASRHLQRYHPFIARDEHDIGMAELGNLVLASGGTFDLQRLESGMVELTMRWQSGKQDAAHTTRNADAGRPIGTDEVDSRRKVLVIDDEPAVREVAQIMLSNMGMDVLLASDGQEALQVFRAQHEMVTAVLLDLKMPRMDGWACLARLREISPVVPVVICSGFNPLDNLPAQAQADEYLTYLSKPFRTDTLRQALAGLGVAARN